MGNSIPCERMGERREGNGEDAEMIISMLGDRVQTSRPFWNSSVNWLLNRIRVA